MCVCVCVCVCVSVWEKLNMPGGHDEMINWACGAFSVLGRFLLESISKMSLERFYHLRPKFRQVLRPNTYFIYNFLRRIFYDNKI